MLSLLGLSLPRGDAQHAILFFGVLLASIMVLAAHGRPIGGHTLPTTHASLNRDQEQLRYWLDEAQRPGADVAACLAVAAIYLKRLAAGGANDALRLRYQVATSRQHQEREPGGR